MILTDNHGFSLLELLAVMAIAVVFLCLGLADYSSFWHQNKTTVVVNQIITALNETRSQAIMRNTVVTFCGTSDHLQCDGAWSKGQMIQVDHEPPARVYPPLTSEDQLYWRSNLGMNNEIKFAPTGFTNGQNGSFYYCPHNINFKGGAVIVISLSGRIRVDSKQENVLQGCTAKLSSRLVPSSKGTSTFG